MSPAPALFWFRQDLRLSDNPGLCAAVKRGRIYPIYILDEVNPGPHFMGAASKWWLHHSLLSLQTSLGGKLNYYWGDPAKIIPALCQRYDIDSVFWNRCYEPWRSTRDKKLKADLKERGICTESFNASLLWEPWEVHKSDGTPYKVFTPFYRKGCMAAAAPRRPLERPATIEAVKDEQACALEDLKLLPSIRWDAALAPHWDIGEAGAQQQLTNFLQEGLQGYKEGRDYPARHQTSRLSPYLHSGEISPHQVWYAALSQGQTSDSDHFCTELAWREFSYSLLHHFPALPHQNWQRKFDAFPWRHDPAALKRWQQGMTGYPIVDAGMRELWQTGYMHNRVRMIVASFLIKNLLIDWRQGAKWFWDCLVDADLANNSASWQWVAGSGADAAPYFRIFNPVTQGEKFDPQGDYIRHYVPEIGALPDKYLSAPWKAPATLREDAGIILGKTYPAPMVDVADSRARALEAFAMTRGGAEL